MDILKHKKVKTRKQHYCYACHRSFPKGTELHNQINVFDGEIGSVYWCDTCEVIMQKHSDYVYDRSEGVFPDGCVQDIPVNYFSRKELIETKWTPEKILERLNLESLMEM